MSSANLALLLKQLSVEAEEAGKPTTIEFGEVISEEYAPLEIRLHDKLILDEPFLELTNAVKDHWVDIEVYWQTIDDNDLAEFNAQNDANILIQNTNADTYNSHTHTGNAGVATPLNGAPFEKQVAHHTSHLHNIAGRKRIRVYNGLHKGEKVILLRIRGGQKFLVLDRLSDHITGGEWQTHGGANIDNQTTAPFVPQGLPGWIEGATSESKWPNAAKPSQYSPGATGPK